MREMGELAAQALRVEARLTPKPGLIDQVNSGSHNDMDLALLLRSADVLEPFFVEMVRCGGDTGVVRDLGVRAEAAMRTATGGVNTHQGAIYSLGLICAVASGGGDVEQLCGRVSRLAVEIAGDERLASSRSDARRLGLGGARGEAASGFKTVRNVALPVYRARVVAGWTQNEALTAGLVALMASNDDTNLVARGGVKALVVVKRWAAGLRHVEDPRELVEALSRADEAFRRRNWSPGGSADLLAVTWLLDEWERR